MSTQQDEIWVVVSCPWDKANGTNTPSYRVGPTFKTQAEAEDYMRKNYPKHKWPNKDVYGTFRTDKDGKYFF